MRQPALVLRELERIARQTLTGCPHGTYGELMERLEAMRDLRHRAGHFEAIAGRALELLKSGEWQEPGGGPCGGAIICGYGAQDENATLDEARQRGHRDCGA